jgi:hypothetical protein
MAVAVRVQLLVKVVVLVVEVIPLGVVLVRELRDKVMQAV